MTRRIHLYQNNTGRKFRNNAPGVMANTVCKHNATGCATTTEHDDVTCRLCLAIMRPKNPRIDVYKRITPRVSAVRLREIHSTTKRPRYIGFRINLWSFALEVSW